MKHINRVSPFKRVSRFVWLTTLRFSFSEVEEPEVLFFPKHSRAMARETEDLKMARRAVGKGAGVRAPIQINDPEICEKGGAIFSLK